MKYICKICKTDSDKSEFYSGVTSRCKECHKKKSRENRAQKADYYRQYDAERYQNDPKVKERHRRYRKTDNGKLSIRKARKKWLSENPEKRAAHIILGNRIKSGQLVKPETCQECGCKPKRIEGHHEDYAKPLDVIWLCRQCHVEKHKDATNA